MKIGMKVFLVLFMILIVMGVYNNAYAQEWKTYYETDNERFYFDNTSIERPDKTYIKFWQKVTEKQAGSDEVDKFRSLIEMNCSKRLYRIVTLVEYDTITGRAMPSQEFGEDQPWTRFSLDSRFGVIYETFCRR